MENEKSLTIIKEMGNKKIDIEEGKLNKKIFTGHFKTCDQNYTNDLRIYYSRNNFVNRRPRFNKKYTYQDDRKFVCANQKARKLGNFENGKIEQCKIDQNGR